MAEQEEDFSRAVVAAFPGDTKRRAEHGACAASPAARCAPARLPLKQCRQPRCGAALPDLVAFKV